MVHVSIRHLGNGPCLTPRRYYGKDNHFYTAGILSNHRNHTYQYSTLTVHLQFMTSFVIWNENVHLSDVNQAGCIHSHHFIFSLFTFPLFSRTVYQCDIWCYGAGQCLFSCFWLWVTVANVIDADKYRLNCPRAYAVISDKTIISSIQVRCFLLIYHEK